MAKLDFSSYLSPFSWRYGSEKMRQIFSEYHKYQIWRRIWVELAGAQFKEGLISKRELADLKKHQDDIDIQRILEIEEHTRHDVVAAIKEFAEKAKIGGGKIHLGATSMDIQDNGDIIKISEALEIIEQDLKKLLQIFAQKIEEYANFPCMGYTHLQPAEPTTLGYRFAFYAQDLLTDLDFLQFVKRNLKSKGFKGAVGTSASYVKLLDERKAVTLGKEIMEKLGVEEALVTSQTYPRKIEYLVASLLSSIAQSLHKFAFDLRVMQSPGFGEWQEPFGKNQVGSSAMPFKKNPWNAEQVCSLARLIFNFVPTALNNAANMLLERTLDDSVNRRVIIPEMFLASKEMIKIATRILDGLIIHQKRVAKNLENFWPFSATEAVMMEAVKNGADRQKMHEILREISLKAWEKIQDGKPNPMVENLLQSEEIGKFLKKTEIEKLLDVNNHLGLAPKKALQLVKQIRKII